jgi:hypothetical protein
MKTSKKSGNPPHEDLAKYGYKPYKKYKTLISPPISLITQSKAI